MENLNNRVHDELNSWRQKEEANIPVFPDNVIKSPECARLRLRKLNEIIVKLKFKTSEHEAYSLDLIKIWQKRLFEDAYPKANVFSYLMYSFINGIRNRVAERKLRGEENIQKAKIMAALTKIGFSGSINRVLAKIDLGERNFSLFANPDSGPKISTSFKLEFGYGEYTGHSFEGYGVNYKNDGDSLVKRDLYYRNDEYILHADKATNLIAGRSILDITLKGKEWIRYDFNDIDDVTGTFRLQTCPNQDFSIQNECAKLSFWRSIPYTRQLDIVSGLLEGNRKHFSITRDGETAKYSIEVDPFANRILVYNDKNRLENQESKLGVASQPIISSPKTENSDVLNEKSTKMRRIITPVWITKTSFRVRRYRRVGKNV